MHAEYGVPGHWDELPNTDCTIVKRALKITMHSLGYGIDSEQLWQDRTRGSKLRGAMIWYRIGFRSLQDFLPRF